MRYREWGKKTTYSRRECNLEIVAAARRARELDSSLASARDKEEAIAQLLNRRAEVIEKIEKIDVMIKQMQHAGLQEGA
jgi:hypothetical protein